MAIPVSAPLDKREVALQAEVPGRLGNRALVDLKRPQGFVLEWTKSSASKKDDGAKSGWRTCAARELKVPLACKALRLVLG